MAGHNKHNSDKPPAEENPGPGASTQQLADMREALKKTGIDNEYAEALSKELEGKPGSAEFVTALTRSPAFGLMMIASAEAKPKSPADEKISKLFELMSKFKKDGMLDNTDKLELNNLIHDPKVRERMVEISKHSPKSKEVVNKALDELQEVYTKSGADKLLSQNKAPTNEITALTPTQIAAAAAMAKDSQRSV